MLHKTVACYFSTPNLIYTPIPKAQVLNLALYPKAQALNLALYLKAQALNLAQYLKAQALNLALTPFAYAIFKHKLSKIKKYQNNQQSYHQKTT